MVRGGGVVTAKTFGRVWDTERKVPQQRNEQERATTVWNPLNARKHKRERGSSRVTAVPVLLFLFQAF